MQSLPNHVGLIPDGTRRWARLREMELRLAYDIALRQLAVLTDHLYCRGIPEVSLYMLSHRNLDRRPADLAAVIRSEANSLSTHFAALVRTHNARVYVAGRRDRWPAELVEPLERLTGRPTGEVRRRLNLCVAYDPVDELSMAITAGSDWRAKLWVPTPVDLVIRTGGVKSLSDFLPLQAAYAQLYFLEDLFNDFGPSDLEQLLAHYQGAEPRMGL